jgi:hypothetical protein
MDKAQMRQVLSDVRRVLREHWDPIGMNDVLEASDEYDSYAPNIYSLLLQGATDAEIAGRLRGFETENMGLSSGSSKQHLASVIAALLAIDLELP